MDIHVIVSHFLNLLSGKLHSTDSAMPWFGEQVNANIYFAEPSTVIKVLEPPYHVKLKPYYLRQIYCKLVLTLL